MYRSNRLSIFSIWCVVGSSLGFAAFSALPAAGEEPTRDSAGNLLITVASGHEVHCKEGSVERHEGGAMESCILTEAQTMCESGYRIELQKSGYLKACTLGRFGINFNGSLPCGSGRIVLHDNNNLERCNLRESFHFYDAESELHNCAAGTDVVFDDENQLISCMDIPVKPPF